MASVISRYMGPPRSEARSGEQGSTAFFLPFWSRPFRELTVTNFKHYFRDSLMNKTIQNIHSHKADITLLLGIIFNEVSAKTSVVVDDENT